MDAKLEARALTLLDEALECPLEDRETWLADRCGTDDRLRARVASLLRLGDADRIRTGAAPLLVGPAELPERIGAYRITGLIGQGGMGAVYRGERVAGDFDHVAAIKLIRPGALSETLIERFRRERQTLARLAHPHIARLFDGGETAEGQPYLVMEYVEGRPLSAWLDDEQPSLAARLELFGKICQAVAYAHQNLVIHRDLTPSNVLVDQDGEPKLIDFGIARPVGEQAGHMPAQTATPGFAAPERLQGAAATTLGDIYALGKLLERITAHEVDPEIVAIARRAAALDPHSRYPGADALAEDVARYGSGRPVHAAAGGRTYVVRKFVARNRGPVIAGGLALAAVVVALLVSLIALGNAQRARAAETARFSQLRSLAGYMLFDLNDQLRRVPGNVGPRVSLAERAQRYLSSLAGAADTSPKLRLEIVDGLLELARVQGSPVEPNLGEAPMARANIVRAEEELAALGREFGSAPAIARRQAQLRAYSAMMQLHGLKNAKDSEASLAAAGQALASVPSRARDVEWHQARRLLRRARLEFFDLQERIPELEQERRLLTRDMSEWPASLRASAASDFDRGHGAYYGGIGQLVRQRGDQGAGAFQRAYASYAQAYRRDGQPSTLYMMGWSAFLGFEAAEATGDRATASRLVAQTRAIGDRLRALDDKDDATYVLGRNADEAYAKDLASRGAFREAIAAQAKVVDDTRRRLAMSNGTGVDLANSERLLGDIAHKAGDRALACRSWTAASERFAAVERKGKLLAAFKGYLPDLREKARLCAAGAELAEIH